MTKEDVHTCVDAHTSEEAHTCQELLTLNECVIVAELHLSEGRGAGGVALSSEEPG